MKPSDIKVGQKYKHKLTDAIYIGAGKRVMWQGTFENSVCQFTNKCLVDIGIYSEYAGQIVQDPEDCFEGFWDNIYSV